MKVMRILLLAVSLCLAISPVEAAMHAKPAAFFHKSGSKVSKPKRNNYNRKKNTHKPPSRPKVVHAK